MQCYGSTIPIKVIPLGKELGTNNLDQRNLLNWYMLGNGIYFNMLIMYP